MLINLENLIMLTNLEIWLTNRIASNYSFRKAFDLVPHNLNHMK